MKEYNVLALVGGISSTSINKRLYTEILKQNMEGLSFQTFDISILPFFSQDIENNYPPSVKELKTLVKNSDAILFITPEYNRSFPGVLKNALDCGSRPTGDNCWKNKPAAIMGASNGSLGTLASQQHLRNVCSTLNMHLMSQPEFYFNASIAMNENGIVETSVDFLQKFLNNFKRWIEVFKQD